VQKNKSECGFNYYHLDSNQNKNDEKKDKTNEENNKDKEHYLKLCKSHVIKKGQKKYWSNMSKTRKNESDLI